MRYECLDLMPHASYLVSFCDYAASGAIMVDGPRGAVHCMKGDRIKVLSVVGARPQFIKAAPVGRALLSAGIEDVLVHTGQHYDPAMSDVFFSELGIEEPRYNLGVGSGAHGAQTGAMLGGIEEVIVQEKPDWVLIYGDTNSTLAGALAAVKLGVPVAHVEAGLRSYNRAMPEEINRVVADALSTLLFCPTGVAEVNLEREGITSGVHVVGDVMYDAVLWASERVGGPDAGTRILEGLGLERGKYLLATVHRASNTDAPENLTAIMWALRESGEPVIFPVHPRTRKALAEAGIHAGDNVMLCEPVSYLDMLALEKHARAILTDSGGVQKEALWLQVPCVTLRNETEWVETVECGWNTLAGTNPARILEALAAPRPTDPPPHVYGDGHASERIAELLKSSNHKAHKEYTKDPEN